MKFYDYNIEFDTTTTISFERNGHHYQRIESAPPQNTISCGTIEQQKWEEFEILCASDTSLYRRSHPLAPNQKRFWRVEIVYANGKTINYASTFFDNEGYLTLLDCFGEYIGILK